MSKEAATANTTRKRMKGMRSERAPRIKRTAAQLAHLEDLVEEKKPGNLYGSFSVFEFTSPEVKEAKVLQKANHGSPMTYPTASSSSSITATTPASMKREYSDPEFVNPCQRDHLIATIPNISRTNLQSFTNIRPFSDFRANRIAGIVCDDGDNLEPIHQQAQAYPHSSISPHSYVYAIPQHPSLPPIEASFPIRSIEVLNSIETTPNTGTAKTYEDPDQSTENASTDSTPNPPEPPIVEDFWKWSSNFMLKGPRGAELARLEDCLSEDILIRAIVSGWDSIGERWELPPFWQIIRQLDENLFYLFGPVERLASFRVIHVLMRYHSDPTALRAATLPNFYKSNNFNFEGDYYIGNFLPWPGIRELTKNPLHPCRTNKWFRAQQRTLKVLWPYRLEDCFTRSAETGLFQLNSDFDRRAHDINCWTFGPDMYEDFPMVFGCAPSRGTIPGTPDLVGTRGAVLSGKRPVTRCIEYLETDQDDEAAADKTRRVESERVNVVEDGIRALMKENSVDYNNLHWREEQRDGKKVMFFTLW